MRLLCWSVLVPPLPLLSEAVNTLLTIDLLWLVDNMRVEYHLFRCYVNLQVICVIPPHQTQLKGLYYCVPVLHSLLGRSIKEDQFQFTIWPSGQFAYTVNVRNQQYSL